MKCKIATNFIWRVGHGVHHRDSTLPPYGWSNHEVNSERLFFSSIRRVEHRGVKRDDKVQVLFPGTNTATSNEREPICALPVLLKLATSTKRDPICALLLQSVSAVWLSCSLEQKYPPPLEQNWTPQTSTDRSVPCQFSQSRPLRTNANRSVPRRLYQGWPPRTTSIRLRPACSVKVDTV